MARHFFSGWVMLIGVAVPFFGQAAVSDKSTTFSSKTGDKTACQAPAAKQKQAAKTEEIRTYSRSYSDPSLAGTPLGSPILGNRLVAFPAGTADDDGVTRVGGYYTTYVQQRQVSVNHSAPAPAVQSTTVATTRTTTVTTSPSGSSAHAVTVATNSHTTETTVTHTSESSHESEAVTHTADTVAHPSETVTRTTEIVSHSNETVTHVAVGDSRHGSDDDSGLRTHDRLARVTAYWSSEGDYYTGRGISSTGVRLHEGHCAVDPNIIPYGSIVEIEGLGRYLAVDTGTAVINRTAAREGGHNSAERNAIVIDVYFESAREGERFESNAAKYTTVRWWTPSTADSLVRARSLFADENWSKIQSKQL